MSDTEEMNNEDQEEESLEAPATEEGEEEEAEEAEPTEEPAEVEVDPTEDNEEPNPEGEDPKEEVEPVEDDGADDDAPEDAENEEGADAGGNEAEKEDNYDYEDDFEKDDDEGANEEGGETIATDAAQSESPSHDAGQSGSPSHSSLSSRAMDLIDSKVSEILLSFSSANEQESQSNEQEDDQRGSSSSSSSSDSDSSDKDVIDGEEGDRLDGVTDEHRLQRLHTIIAQNDFRKFRWFSSLFISDIVRLEELCQVLHNGSTAMSLLGELGRTKMLKRLSELGVLLYHQDPDGQAAIHRAVRNGHVKTVNYLCTLGQSTYQDTDGMTPLHICATTKHVKVMDALAEHCPSVDIPYGSSHLTPLMLACMNGCVEMVDCLLKHGAKMEASNSVGNTCLHLATANNQFSTVRKLLEAEDISDAIDKRNKQGSTPLHTALQLRHLDVFDRLLEAGADPTCKNQQGMGAVHIAAVLGIDGAITLLDIHGADLNLQEEKGATPLLLAVSQGHKEIAQKLLSLGADVNICDVEGVTPLHAVCREGDVSGVKQLMDAGARVNEISKQGMTPLCAAVIGGHLEVIKILLDNNADPNLSASGISPMAVACQGMKANLVDLLLASGGSPFQSDLPANQPPRAISITIKRRYTIIMNKIINKYNDSPSLYKIIKCCTLDDVEFLRHTDFIRHKNNQNGFGWTLLHHATAGGNDIAVDLLLRLGCDPNIQDHDGNTPVHFACIHGHGAIVAVLTDSYNTDIRIANNKGDTCMNLAIQSGKEEIVSLLLSCQSLSGGGESSQVLPLLVQAITAGQTGVAEMLFMNASSEIQRYNDWKQLIHMAVEQGSAKLLTLMLEHGPIDVLNPITDSDETCLHLAARSGNLETSMELLMRKSDVNKMNALQRKPIHYAAIEGHTSVVEVLLDCGTKVSLVDEDGVPDYYLCKHTAVWDILKTWCKTHPGSVTTAPSPSAPPSDTVDGRRMLNRASRSSSASAVVQGELDGFQEIGTPTHVRLPAAGVYRRGSSPLAAAGSPASGSPSRRRSHGVSPLASSQAPPTYHSASHQQQRQTSASLFDSFRDTLL